MGLALAFFLFLASVISPGAGAGGQHSGHLRTMDGGGIPPNGPCTSDCDGGGGQ